MPLPLRLHNNEDNMKQVVDFLQEYQGLINASLISVFFWYVRRTAVKMVRTIDLMRIKQEASIYASQRVNGEYKNYSEEWLRHYNIRLDQLMKDYKFQLT